MKKILDHGYVKFVEAWGSDASIIEAARMSTDKGFLGWGPNTNCKKCGVKEDYLNPGQAFPYQTLEQMGCEAHEFETKPGDEKLLRYLYENKHATPFEMGGIVIEVQAPIFVFREWHRHRTQSYNEMSARYTPLPDINYVPSIERLMVNANGSNKQAGKIAGSEVLTVEEAEMFRTELIAMYDRQEWLYQRSLKAGVPKELARIHLPVGRYSKMRAQANLRNWLAFLTLRQAPGAQWEIREYANAVAQIVAECFPRTYELFAETVV